MQKLIKIIEKSIQPHFIEPINIHQDGYGIYRLSSNDTSEAKDFHKNDLNDIRVVKWFGEYWLKLTINFIKIDIETTFKLNTSGISKSAYIQKLSENNLKIENDFFETIISFALFRGDYDCFSKSQLFRAEWDNYRTVQDKHPQPHWQFYQTEEYRKKLDEANPENIFEITDELGFSDFLKDPFDLKKFHFAMNGNWINNESHIHSLNSPERMIKWFNGLLKHLKSQLEYLSE